MTSPEALIGCRAGRTSSQKDLGMPSLDHDSCHKLSTKQHLTGMSTQPGITTPCAPFREVFNDPVERLTGICSRLCRGSFNCHNSSLLRVAGDFVNAET